jgi:hypothetical protein
MPTDGPWVVICDKKDHSFIRLFFLDRHKVRNAWWSDQLRNAKLFAYKNDADIACGNMKFGNPEVVTLEMAQKIEAGNIAFKRRSPINLVVRE